MKSFMKSRLFTSQMLYMIFLVRSNAFCSLCRSYGDFVHYNIHAINMLLLRSLRSICLPKNLLISLCPIASYLGGFSKGVHLFLSRTEKLSLLWPIVLVFQPGEKVAAILINNTPTQTRFFYDPSPSNIGPKPDVFQ